MIQITLLHTSGPQKGHRTELVDEITILGKGADCEIRIPSSYASRQHCQIARTGQQVVVHDLSSKNGTWVNGKQITSEALLTNGDELSVGRVNFKVFVGESGQLRSETSEQEQTDYRTLLAPLIGVIEAESPLFYHYGSRINKVAQLLAVPLGMDPVQMESLTTAAWLSNLQMLKIPSEILESKKTLTADQWAEIKKHPENATRAIRTSTLRLEITHAIRHHHERYNGSGYPDGLSREAIPWMARILAVSEAMVAMASDRPYRKALDLNTIRREIQKNSGEQFDPQCAIAAGDLLAADSETISPVLWGGAHVSGT